MGPKTRLKELAFIKACGASTTGHYCALLRLATTSSAPTSAGWHELSNITSSDLVSLGYITMQPLNFSTCVLRGSDSCE